MAPINFFIRYVVENLVPLNEYSDKIIDALTKHYEEEAKDYGYDKLKPEQIKKYIKRFDKIKDTVKSKEGLELFRMKGNDYEPLIELPKLIQLVTAAADVEAEPDEEEEKYEPDTRPNAIYSSNDGKIVIYKGDSENLCVRFRTEQASDVSWCVTRSSYGTYRYSRNRGYPTFYLAKNENLPQDNPTSAVAIQVADPKLKSENERYRWTNRKNSPGESSPMSWNELTRQIPWLKDIPNIKEELKYIPLTPQEKAQVQYGSEEISIQEWLDKSYSQKINYLAARAQNSDLFDNITNENFAAKVLPRFPNIAEYLAENPTIIPSTLLLTNYDKYTKDAQKSIISNLLSGGKKIKTYILKDHSVPFEALTDITDRNGWNDVDKYYYTTKNRKAIIGLNTDTSGKVTLDVYTPDIAKEDVKLTDRTAKFIEQNPAPSRIPIKDLNGLIKNNVVTSDKVLKDLESDPKAPVAVKKEEDGNFVFDSRTFGVYQLGKEGFTAAPEEAVNYFSEELDSSIVKKKALSLLRDSITNLTNLPPTLDQKTLASIISKIPQDERVLQDAGGVILAEPGKPIIVGYLDPNEDFKSLGYPLFSWEEGVFRRNFGRDYYKDNPEQKQLYINYLRRNNKTIKDETLKSFLDSAEAETGIDFLRSNFPLDPENKLVPVVEEDTIFLINKDRPSENYKKAYRNRKLVDGRLNPGRAEQMLQAAQPRTPTQAQLAQRAQQAQAARAEEPGEQPAQQQPAPQGQLTGEQIQQAFTARNISYRTLPNAIRNRIAAGGQAVEGNDFRGDRGAQTRNSLLRQRGRVVGIIRLTGRSSAIYFIQLASGVNIASIAQQPGNYQYIATNNNSYQMRSIEQLANILQAANINEGIKGVCVREFLANNPSMLDEVKTCVKNYLKERKMKKVNLEMLMLAEVLKKAVKENTVTKPKPGTTTKPKPGTVKPNEKPNKPGKIGNPNVAPNPKAMNEEEKTLQKIVQRYKSRKK